MLNSPTPKTMTDNLAYALAQAHRGVHLKFERVLKAESVQVEHWRVLDVLSDEKGRSMGELADIVLMNPPALTKMLDKMVANGLAHRSLDPEDNRRVLVFTTDTGLELHHKLHSHAVRLHQIFESSIGEKKMRSLQRLLAEVSKLA